MLAGRQRAPDQPVVIGDLDGDRHKVHLWTRRQLSAIGESQRDSEGLGGGLGRVETGGSDSGDLVLVEGPQCREMGGGPPAPGGVGADDAHPDRRAGCARTLVRRPSPGSALDRGDEMSGGAPSSEVPRDRVALHGHRPVVLGHVRIDRAGSTSPSAISALASIMELRPGRRHPRRRAGSTPSGWRSCCGPASGPAG